MIGFRLGYGTNGFSDHRLDDALAVIADLGYTGVGLTLDHHHLDPYADDLAQQVRAVAARLVELDLRVVVETGARYLLDPHRKHHPTLLSEHPEPRIDLLRRAVRIADDLGADCVSFWSGTAPDGLPADVAWRRLTDGVDQVLDEATRRGVRLALEPEPGHLVQHLDQARQLRRELGAPALLGVTLDVGHCVAVEPDTAADCIRRAGPLLFNVQLDDMRPAVHEHLEFGDGDLDLAETLGALSHIGYTGVAAVELPRHSHAAPLVAARAMTALVTATGWLAQAQQAIRADSTRIRSLFPAAGRNVGRGPLRPADDPRGYVFGTIDDQARGTLLTTLADVLPPPELAVEVTDLYRHGDAAERRGVVRALPLLPTAIADTGREITEDALRTNDIGLVAAAMGPFAAGHLDAPSWRHGVLKCLFTGIPLIAVAGLNDRTDAELVRMVKDYAAERVAAGRDVPADAQRMLEAVK